MMKLTKSSRAFRRATAVALAFALTVSAPVANNASAASKKVPTLSAKKKTLYVKGGTKSFTLKVNKNKVKKLTNTKWTTSKKSVAKISKKKTASVKVTAVKKGTATIKGVVTYKVGKKTKKKTLTCKVTVKAKKAVTVTEAPATSTPNATATATGSTVTATPAAQVATSIKVTAKDDVKTIGTAEKLNKATLAAEVLDANGKAMETKPEVTWASSDEKIATVKDGEVTGVAEGKATITATVKTEDGKEIKGEYEITVDATAPKLVAADSKVTDYKTLTVAFSEAVKGTPTVEVFKNGSRTKMEGLTAVLAEDGKSITITSDKALAGDSEYEVKVSDVTDAAKNPIAKDASVILKKAKSFIKKIVAGTPEVPAPDAKQKNAVEVYYTVEDQYGEAFDTLNDGGKMSATAKIDGTDYPLTATIDKSSNIIRIAYQATLLEGKKIVITCTNNVNNADNTSSIEVTLVKNEGKGVATAIKTLAVKETNAKNAGTASAAEFTLDPTVTSNNKCGLTVSLADKFGYPVTQTASVTYVISNTKVLNFDTTSSAVYTGTTIPGIKLVGAGEATVKAYLSNNDTVSSTVSIKVNASALTGLEVSNTSTAGKGATADAGVDNYYELTFKPLNYTATTISDLNYVVTKGADVADISFVVGNDDKINNAIVAKKGVPYVKVTPKAAAESKPIEVIIYANGTYNETTKQFSKGTVRATLSLNTAIDKTISTIEIKPFEDQTVTVGKKVKTEVVLRNKYGTDITAALGATAEFGFGSSSTAIINNATNMSYEYDAVAKKGYLVVTPSSKGYVTISMSAINNTVNTTTSLTVYDAASISNMALSVRAIDAINKDTLAIAGDTTRVKVGNYYATLTQPTFYNQYGKETQVTFAEYNTIVVTTLNGAYGSSIVPLTKDGTGAYVKATNGTDIIYMLGVVANTDNAADINNSAVYKFTTKDNKEFDARLNVVVKAARELTTFTPADGQDAVSQNMIVGSKISVAYKSLDQYGQKYELTDSDITITDLSNGGVVKKVSADKNAFTLQLESGSGLISGYVTAKKLSIPLYVTVKSLADVTSIEVNSVNTAASYDSTVKAARFGNDAITFTATAKVGNDTVSIDSAEDIQWVVKSYDLKSAVDGKLISKPEFAKNALTIANDKVNVSGSVTVYAMTNYGVTSAEKTFKFSNVDSIAQNGTFYVSTKADGSNKVTTVTRAIADTTTLYVFAVDQYEKAMNASACIKKVTSYDNANVIAAKNAAGTAVELTAGKAATTTNVAILVTSSDNTSATLTIAVTNK